MPIIIFTHGGSSGNATLFEVINDLNKVYQMYKIKKANLIGHRFGGLVARLYTEQNPEKVNS